MAYQNTWYRQQGDMAVASPVPIAHVLLTENVEHGMPAKRLSDSCRSIRVDLISLGDIKEHRM
jgi:hypothetical protein